MWRVIKSMWDLSHPTRVVVVDVDVDIHVDGFGDVTWMGSISQR